MDKQYGAVEIVATPEGEAPLWVREAWVGLILPLVPGWGKRNWRSFGVLSAPRTRLGALWGTLFNARRVEGYLVPSAEAIRLLAMRNPGAATWWRTHTDFADCEQACFIFDAPACRPIG
jgi:hypothetical protein